MATQLNLSFSLPKTTNLWQGYSASTLPEQARAKFEKKYGRLPSKVVRNGGALLLGPLTDAEAVRRQ